MENKTKFEDWIQSCKHVSSYSWLRSYMYVIYAAVAPLAHAKMRSRDYALPTLVYTESLYV